MKKLTLAICVVAVAALTGCKREEPGGSESEPKELRLYCGAGIRPPVAQMAEAFEREHGVKVAVDYAGSEVLLSKIFDRHRVSIKRAVERGELPPSVRLFGEPVWTVKALREHLSRRLEQAKRESEQLQKRIDGLCA